MENYQRIWLYILLKIIFDDDASHTGAGSPCAGRPFYSKTKAMRASAFIIPDGVYIFAAEPKPIFGNEHNEIPEAKHAIQCMKMGFVVPFKGAPNYNPSSSSNKDFEKPKWIDTLFGRSALQAAAAPAPQQPEEEPAAAAVAAAPTVRPRRKRTKEPEHDVVVAAPAPEPEEAPATKKLKEDTLPTKQLKETIVRAFSEWLQKEILSKV